MSQITCPSHHYRDAQDLDVDKYPELAKLANIQVRKGGPTNELSGNRAKKNRNEAIHDVVQLSSFGDISSK